MGLMTAADFGPSPRFVHGASFTAPRLPAGVVRRRRPSEGLSLPDNRSAHDPSVTAGHRTVGQVAGTAAGAFAPAASFGVTVRANG
ncbi:hypothetical protein ACFC96_19910 [Streptomyces sp. NPDC055955]|uniref:hypothetical protein n=1 Tax=Streptomyces sp. NPDC055955 TaxID=3345665 RepID=UPI0035D7C6CB